MSGTNALFPFLRSEPEPYVVPVNSLMGRINAQPIGAERWQQSVSNQSDAFNPLVGFVDKNPILQSDVDRLPVNPVSGALTPAGEFLTNTLMGASSNIKSIPQRIAQYAEGMGYNVARESSNISGSEYLSLLHDKLPDQNLKVRVSSHDLPSRYGSPGDYDVHAGAPRDTSVDWKYVVQDLAQKAGVPVPGPVARALSAANTRDDIAAQGAERIRMMNPAYQEGILQQAYPQEWARAQTMQSGDRSAARGALVAAYEQANPGKVPWAPYLSKWINP
jgi:hypothetical protein